jgi:hypothetical protein
MEAALAGLRAAESSLLAAATSSTSLHTSAPTGPATTTDEPSSATLGSPQASLLTLGRLPPPLPPAPPAAHRRRPPRNGIATPSSDGGEREAAVAEGTLLAAASTLAAEPWAVSGVTLRGEPSAAQLLASFLRGEPRAGLAPGDTLQASVWRGPGGADSGLPSPRAAWPAGDGGSAADAAVQAALRSGSLLLRPRDAARVLYGSSTMAPGCGFAGCANLAAGSEAALPRPVACSGCGQAHYCSDACRAADWAAGHQRLCRGDRSAALQGLQGQRRGRSSLLGGAPGGTAAAGGNTRAPREAATAGAVGGLTQPSRATRA